MPTTEEFNEVAFDVFNRLWDDNFAPHEWDFNDGTTIRVDDFVKNEYKRQQGDGESDD